MDPVKVRSPEAVMLVAPETPAAEPPMFAMEIPAPDKVNELNAVPLPIAPLMVVFAEPESIVNACPPSMVEENETVPSLVVLFVLMVTSAPKVTGPVNETLLLATSAVVMLPLSVIPEEPVIVTDLISLPEPIAPTETVFVEPPEEVRVTVWLEVPRIVPIEIAPPPETTARLEPLAS